MYYDIKTTTRRLWLIGDEAILWVVIDEFKKTFGNVDFTVLSSNPWRTKKDSWRESNEEAHHISQLPKTFFLRSHVLVFARQVYVT